MNIDSYLLIVLESIRIVLESIRYLKRRNAVFNEDINHEFKKKYVKNIVKTVIAFANTSGGKVFVGVEDDGVIVGLDDPDSEMLKFTNAVRDNITPDVTPFMTFLFEKFDDKTIIVCEIQKGTSCPYYLSSKGLRPEGVYVRQGASSVPASQSHILKLIKETHGDNYEELRSLNQQLTFESLMTEFRSDNILLEKPQMKSLGIIGDDDLYTNLGLLLSDQCYHSIKAAVFEGVTKNLFRDRFEFKGSLVKQMRDAYAFVNRYNRTQSRIEGIDRIDIRDYPEEALREVLLNSIVHKDYGFSSSTLVSVFDDRIEVLTIGGLANGLTINDIMIGTSLLRNPRLGQVLYRLKWIEAYGIGILKIKEAYASYDLEPLFEITENAFKVTLPAIGFSVKQIQKEYTENEKKVIEMLQKLNLIKRLDVEKVLGVSQPMAVKVLRSLLDKHAIEKIGTGKSIHYRLLKKK